VGDPLSRLTFLDILIPLAAYLLLLFPALTVNDAAAAARALPAGGSSAAGQSSAGTGKLSGAGLSVLDRFRSYDGQRTIEGLTALFDLPAGSIIRQQPIIAISDGRTAVIVAVRLTPVDGRAINFSFEGATPLSTRKIKADEWELKALPDRGTVEMALLIRNGPATVSYPLTVAPGVTPDTDLSARGFQAFLDREQAAADLNSDGRTDYLDDYIFTANFLSRQQATGRDRSARRQRALKRTLAVEPVH